MHANLPTTELLPARFCAKPDIVRRFLAWVQTADANARAQGASALARAYLYCDLPASVRAEAVLAMTVLLDDPSVCVRRSLAEALCRAHDAPRGVVLALAADEPEAAAAVLQYSPVLTDADLVDCVASGDVVTQTALARRSNLPPRAKAALAETGHFDAVRALIANVEIDCPAELLHRIFVQIGGPSPQQGIKPFGRIGRREPEHVRPPESVIGRMRIFIVVGVNVMLAMCRHPHERAAFGRQHTAY